MRLNIKHKTNSHTDGHTVAIVTAFPPSEQSLNEYGLHLVNAFAARPDVKRVIVIADRLDAPCAELELSDKIIIDRRWRFNQVLTARHILKGLRAHKPDFVLYNLQTASFGDREVPAALGLLTPALSRMAGHATGVIMHNLIDAVDLSKTNLEGQKWRQALVASFGKLVTRCLLGSGYVSVTLDSFVDILRKTYKAKNAFLVPHGSFPVDTDYIPRLKDREKTIVTMGKFGTYKKLDRMIDAVQKINREDVGKPPFKLIIGGRDHPATPGYMDRLEAEHADDPNIVFHGYVAEDDVAGFFTQARMAIFDYDSTTGSSGVLHQAAIYGTPPIYPLMGDFIDVTVREGLSGFNYEPLDGDALRRSIIACDKESQRAQALADTNFSVSQSVTMDTVASVQMQLLKALKKGRFYKLRESSKQALWLRPRIGI